MKKILFVIGKVGNGGVSKSLYNLLRDKRRQGYDVSVLQLLDQEYKKDFLPKGVKGITIKTPLHVVWQHNRGWKRAIVLCLRNFKVYSAFKILIANCLAKLYPSKSEIIIMKQILKDMPEIEDEYDIAIDYLGYQGITTGYVADKIRANSKYTYIHTDYSKQGINPNRFIKYYNKYKKIISVSEKSAIDFSNMICNFNKETLEVCYNIVLEHQIINLANSYNTELSNEYDGIKLLTIGRLSYEKGYDIAINACRKLIESGYNVKWYICGDGSERNNLEKLIELNGLKENFILLGNKENPYPYIKECDIYVQTSRFEGYCIALTEAICIGKPIIVTNVTGSEQVKDKETGFIVDIDEIKIYEAIKRMIDNPELMMQFSRNIKRNKQKNKQDIWAYIENHMK